MLTYLFSSGIPPLDHLVGKREGIRVILELPDGDHKHLVACANAWSNNIKELVRP